MVPSGIKRGDKTPFRTRKLDNGTIVVVDAYEGHYAHNGPRSSGTPIRGLRVGTAEAKKVVTRD